MRKFLLILLLLPAMSLAEQKLTILLTNDDGFDSPGLEALNIALSNAGHTVYVVAPATQQSGASASVTASGVKVTAYPGNVWAVHGRPADAVRVALGNILYDTPPDLVISGANFGQNTGQDVNVSGTVGAAITAFRLGVPAIAVSVEIKLDEMNKGFPSTVGAFTGAASVITRLVNRLELKDLTAVLNVNYPARLPLDVRGVRWSNLSQHSVFGTRYNQNSEGKYVPEFELPTPSPRAGDAEALVDGFVTLTFLDGDMAVNTKRSQRYMDQHLLDRSYPPVYPPAEPRRPIKAAATTQAATALTGDPENPTSNTLQERKPTDAVIQLPDTHGNAEQERRAMQETDQAAQHEEDSVAQAGKPAAEEASETAAQPAPPKPKPDSWLRRMFNPASWGN